ncbi:MAG: extracellular solute-binding protein [Armatimonadia bacterium]
MGIARVCILFFLCALAAALLSGCPAHDEGITVEVKDKEEGANRNRSAKSILEGARQERTLNWYTSLKQEEADAFIARFRAKYPFLTVTVRRGGTFNIERDVRKEIDSGAINADVVHVLDPAFFITLANEGNLNQYNSPEASAIPIGYRQEGQWTTARLVTLGMAYDSSRLRPASAPRTWRSLMDQRWQGKIGIKNAYTAGAAYAHFYFMRDRYGAYYWERLAELGTKVYETEPKLLAALRGGEIQVAAGVALGRPAANDSIRMIAPEDGLPVVVGPVAIINGAQHPNSARVFVDYMLSREGQAAMRDLTGAYSPRTDVQPPKGLKPLNPKTLLQPPRGWPEYLEDQDALQREFSKLFGEDDQSE